MGEFLEEACFFSEVPEEFAPLASIRADRLEDFDSDRRFPLKIFGPVDAAHSTLADNTIEPVWAL